MKLLATLLLWFGLATTLEAQAQTRREFNQAELDALLAPVALYPDALLTQILAAAAFPGQVAQAARWSRATRLAGDQAVDAAQSEGWHPSVQALTAFPDVLARMDENPQWLRDLGDAWLGSERHVMETIQQLRRRAEAAGNLRNDGQQQVYRQGETIVVRPVYQQVVYAPYYNPLIVFGTWWWTSYRPVVWRPWIARPVVFHWQHRPPRWTPPAHVAPVRRVITINDNGAPSPAARIQSLQAVAYADRQRALNVQTSHPPQVQVITRPQVQVHPRPQIAVRPGIVRSNPGRPLYQAARAR